MQVITSIKEPLISIIITYYNMGKFIKPCLEAISAQTYRNFEVIIVNDASDEYNSKILKDINNVKIINLTNNRGQLCSLYEGLKVAKGEFVCMIDADDIILPNYLKTLLCAHLNNNFALISSSGGKINENGEILSLNSDTKKISYSEIENLLKEKDYFDIKNVKAPFGAWSWSPSTSAMWRKSAIDILQYFPNKSYWRSGADKVIFSLLHLIGGSANIDAVCFLYRIHSGNNFNASNVSGDTKYLPEGVVDKLIDWNIKLRKDTFNMFLKHKKELIEKYNKINYIKMFLRVIFCVNTSICIKILKTLIHKFAKL